MGIIQSNIEYLVSEMKFLTLFAALILIGCTSNSDKQHTYVAELQISRTAQISLKQIYPSSSSDIDLPLLESKVGVYQLALKSEQNKSLFGLPDLYLSHPGTYKFVLTSSFKADSLSIYKMDGSSGHFSLKNQSPLQSVKITKE